MNNLEVGVRLTADGRGLVGEAGRSRDAIAGLSGEQRNASAASAAYTAQIDRQNASLNAVKTAAAAAAVGIASLKVGSLVVETASLSQRYQELGIILDVAGRNAGVSAVEIDKTTEAVRKSGITMLQSRQAVTSLIKENINLSEATKLARVAQDAAVVAQINSSEALDRLIYGLSTAQIEVLKTMGLTVNFERAYKNMAGQLGKTTDELTDQERMQARLNTVYESGKNIVGAYEGAMNNAGKQYRSTQRQVEDLSVVVGGLFDETSKLAVTAYTDVLKTLTGEVDTLASNGDIIRWGDNIARTFAVAGDAARAAFSPVLILFKTVDSAIARGSALASGDFAKSRQIGADFEKFLKSELDVLTGSTKLQDALQKQLVARDLLTQAVGRGAKALQTATAGVDANTGSNAKNTASLKREAAERKKIADEAEREYQRRVDASVRFIMSTARETEEIGKNAIQKRMLAAATEAANAPTKELAQTIMASAQAWAKATEAEERALAEQKKLKEAAKKRADAETEAARAVQQEWSQMWSTVENTARTSFTQFAAHGVGAMESIGKSIKNAIIDLLYQITVRKWVINIGASIGLSGGSGLAMADGGGIGSILNMASMGSSALNLFKTGFGATSLLSNVGSMLPGSAGSFFAGMGVSGTQAAAAAGAQTLWGASGMGAAASAGSAFAAAAGPAIAVAAVDQIVRMLAGDKMIGGGVGKVLNYALVVGPLINGLFGRGPMKQRETTLSGTIGANGFIDGSLNTDFRAKGGLFRSNKNDFARIDAVTGEISTDNNKLLDYANQLSTVARDVIGLINDTTTQVGGSLKQIGADLAISTDGLDNFSHAINLVSEKGKMLTEEQIAEEIGAISDKMARSLLPNLDEFAKRGETALQTVSRLGLEFATLAEGVSVIFGQSGQAAKDIVNRFSIGDRSEFIEAAGGVENLGQKINQFFGNLDDADKLTILEDRLTTALDAVGVNFIPTMEQFNAAMRSGDLSMQQFIAGLDLQGLIKDVNDLRTALTPVSEITDKAAEATDDAAKKEQDLIRAREGAARASEKAARREAQQREIDKQAQQKQSNIEGNLKAADDRAARERELLKLRFDGERQLLEETRKRSQEITGFIESLRRSAFDVSPLGFEESGNIIASAIKNVMSGADFASIMTERMQAAIRGAGSIDERLYSSFDEFARARGEAASQINDLAGLGENQLTMEGATLAELEKQSAWLEKTYDVLSRRIDSGLAFDKNMAQADLFGGITSAGGTRKQIEINKAQRQLYILSNDLEQDPVAMLRARLNMIKAQYTSEATYGGGRLTSEESKMIKMFQDLAIQMTQTNGYFKRAFEGDALNVRAVS